MITLNQFIGKGKLVLKPDSLNLYTRPPLTFRNSSKIGIGLVALTRESASLCKQAWSRGEMPDFRSGGHSAVTNSLRRGLDQVGVTHTINRKPRRFESNTTAGILAGLNTLRWFAVEATRGNIEGAIVGPNVTVRPSDTDGILTHSFVRRVLVPSTWVRDLYVADQPELADKVVVWASGVDSGFWRPSKIDYQVGEKQCLVYVKHVDDPDVESVVLLCRSQGWRVNLIEYGKYSRREYRAVLQESRFMVYLGASESQGIALFEAWSTGVPTLIRKLRQLPAILEKFPDCEFDLDELSAPYLSDKCGIVWDSMDSLADIIGSLNAYLFSPRSWVNQNGTDAISAQRYIRFW